MLLLGLKNSSTKQARLERGTPYKVGKCDALGPGLPTKAVTELQRANGINDSTTLGCD
jgi:hypothetical protein